MLSESLHPNRIAARSFIRPSRFGFQVGLRLYPLPNSAITGRAGDNGFIQRNGWFGRHCRQTVKLSDFVSHPGIGVKSAQRIVRARRNGNLNFQDLKKIGVTLKRALYFITCNGKMMYPTKIEEDYITRNLIDRKEKLPFDRDGMTYKQLSLFDDNEECLWKNII